MNAMNMNTGGAGGGLGGGSGGPLDFRGFESRHWTRYSRNAAGAEGAGGGAYGSPLPSASNMTVSELMRETVGASQRQSARDYDRDYRRLRTRFYATVARHRGYMR